MKGDVCLKQQQFRKRTIWVKLRSESVRAPVHMMVLHASSINQDASRCNGDIKLTRTRAQFETKTHDLAESETPEGRPNPTCHGLQFLNNVDPW